MHAQAANKTGTRLCIGRVSVMVLAQVDISVKLNPHVPFKPGHWAGNGTIAWVYDWGNLLRSCNNTDFRPSLNVKPRWLDGSGHVL